MRRPILAFVASPSHRSVTSGAERFSSPVVALPDLTLTSSLSALHMSTVSAAATTVVAPEILATSTAAATAAVPGFIKLFLTFIAGGLSFSFVAAGFTALLAIGESNLKEINAILRLLTTRTLTVFWVGLREASRALRRTDGKLQWKFAFRVLMLRWSDTKVAAAEGVDAVRTQAKLYAAAVGAPGLIPVQYVVDRLMPFTIATALEGAVTDALARVKNSNIKRLQLSIFDAGKRAPQLKASRVYDLGENALAFDMDMNWQSDMVIGINFVPRLLGIKIPVTIRKLSFVGSVRVEMTPLTDEPPGYGALLLSFPLLPEIKMEIKVVGGMKLSQTPWLKKEVMSAITHAIEEESLWPKRLVVPGAAKVLTKAQLEQLKERSPFSEAEEKLQEKPLLKEFRSKQEPDRTMAKKLVNLVVGDE